MHIRQPELAPLEPEGEALVINPHEMHECGLEVVHVHLVLHCVEAKFIARTVLMPGLIPPPAIQRVNA